MKFTEKIKEYENKLNETGLSYNEISAKIEEYADKLIRGGKSFKCDDVFTETERKHLEEVLHGDLDGYFEEIKDMSTNNEFEKWKGKTIDILKKCKLNDWKPPEEYSHEEHKKAWKEGKI